MEWWQLIIFGVVCLAMAILSGIAGAGGGFVMTPLAILLGLSPAQSVATGKLNGLAVTIGSLSGLKAHRARLHKGKIAAIMVLALIVGLLAPFVIKGLESQAYQIVLGVIILLMIPLMLYKKVGIKPHTPTLAQKGLGGVLLTISLFLQGAFSGGLGSLVNMVLMGMLGQTATEANITKRWSQLILNGAIIVGVIGSGLIVWEVAIVGMIACLIGGFIGGHIAVCKGDGFALNVLLGLAAVSGVLLIVTAL